MEHCTTERPSERIARRAAAQARWRRRIERTTEAAILAAIEPTGEVLPGGGIVYPGIGIQNADLPTLAKAWALIQLDRHGVGGPFGAGGSGRGTKRMPAFSNLGRGRWLATDGKAWDEAALFATHQIWCAAGRRRSGAHLALVPEGIRVKWWDHEANQERNEVVPYPEQAQLWIRSLAAACVASVADQSNSRAYLDPIWGSIENFRDPDWARILDEQAD